MIRIITILLLALACMTQDEPSHVLTLTETNFQQALQEHPFLFVKFYTPWCTHCKKLAPIFIELANELKTTQPEVTLAEVDLDQHKSIQTKYRVQSFPTLILFRNGEPFNFGGSRTKQFMTSWLAKKILDPIIKIDERKLSQLQNDGRVNIVFYGQLESPQAKMLFNIAKSDDYNMYYAVSNSNRIPNSVQIIRPFGQNIRRDVIDYNIRNWINLYDRPFVYTLDDRASSEVFTQKRNSILLFKPAGQAGEILSQSFREAAQEWKETQKKKFIFIQITADQEQYSGLSDHMKMDPQTRPIVYVKRAQNLKYLYPEKEFTDITSSTLVNFIKAVDAKKIRKYKLDEETRKNPPPEVKEEL